MSKEKILQILIIAIALLFLLSWPTKVRKIKLPPCPKTIYDYDKLIPPKSNFHYKKTITKNENYFAFNDQNISRSNSKTIKKHLTPHQNQHRYSKPRASTNPLQNKTPNFHILRSHYSNIRYLCINTNSRAD